MWEISKWCLGPNLKWKMVICDQMKCAGMVGVKAKFGWSVVMLLATWPSQLWRTRNENLQVQLVWDQLGMKIDTKWHNFHLGSIPKKWPKPSEQIDQT